MSQPRRRRRNRRRRGSGGASGSQPAKASTDQGQSKVVREQAPGASGRRSARGRRRGRGGAARSPASSEDLVRAAPKPAPNQLTAPHDGTTLDQVIRDLQSEWGVPQHPQEYRITLKVADDGRAEAQTIVEERQDPPADQTPAEEAGDGRPRREKAPAAPRITGDGDDASAAKSSGRKRSRRRRRRSRRRPGGETNTGPTTP